MPDGEMRRPPQPWEKKLARLTSIVGGAGISSSGDGTGVVPPTPTPGTGGGTEPAPVLPAPGAFIKPSTPTLLGQVQGINVIWDGLNSASELWPYDTSWVEIHMSTAGTAFTPGTATLKGRLTRPGAYSVGGLAAGTAYYFKLRGADPAGNYTDPSDAATGYTGLTTSSDYGLASIGTGAVSFNARTIGGVTNTVGSATPSSPLTGDVWLDTSPGTAVIHKVYNGSTWVTNAWGSASIAAGQITALQIAAGAITAGAIAAGAVTTDKLTAGTITGFRINGGTISGGYISGGTMSAGYISGGTIDGSSLRTASSGARVEIGSAFSALSSVQLFSSSGNAGAILTDLNGGVTVASSGSTKTTIGNSSGGTDLYGPTVCKSTLAVDGAADCNSTLNVDGSTTMKALDATAVTTDTLASSSDAVVLLGYRTTATGTNAAFRIKSNVTSTDTIHLEVTANGNVKNTNNSYGSLSDANLKENITPARDYLDDLRSVDIINFNFIGADEKLLGVTAQQLATVFPSMVETGEDGALSVKYSVFVPMLITAVQSLADKVDDLTARIEALEA